ncbi:MAG: cephalosporin hydroxylase family protein [Gammaproteobacteria bacterium]|nr:cephalosporin hydroxylase family protein [Gammaproteobacteria bacterium]
MNEIDTFKNEVNENIKALGKDKNLQLESKQWLQNAGKHKYTYNFTWLGRPIIQTPQDILALQEIIWSVKPDLIIETGIAHGGSLILSASILELLNLNGEVLGIDIDIRAHNRKEIEGHPLSKRITMLEGSSIDKNIISNVIDFSKDKKNILVVLDSNHTHEHVLQELNAYSALVSSGGYIVVMDTAIEDMPSNSFPERSWDVGNNPKTAVDTFLQNNERFTIDYMLENKLLITVAPGGYLKCIKD